MLPIDALIEPVTEEQANDTMLDILETLSIPARAWRKGSAARVIVRICARLYAAFTVIISAFVRSGFLETAAGGWLTALAKYVYGVDRRVATFARGDVQLTNTGGGLFDQAARSVTVLSPTTKKAYRNVSAFVLNPGQVLAVEVEAIEQGSASSAAPGTIDDFETNLAKVEVTNLLPFIALDEESDPELKQACRDKLGSLSVRGPRGAYAWAVREATRDDGGPVNINRVRVSSSSSTGKVTTTVAAPDGAPLDEDLVAVRASVEERARPDGVTAIVAPATEVVVTRALTIYAKRADGVDANAIRALVETAFVRDGATYPVGGLPKPPLTQGKVWADWIVGTAKGAHETIYEVDGDGDDVDLSATEVAVFAITAPTVRIVEGS
jgi:phage-related baseplate assembly protein